MIVAAIIAAAAALIGAAIASGDQAKAQAIREDIAKKYGAQKLPHLDRLVAQKLPPDAAARYMASTQSTRAQSDVLGKWMEQVDAKGETTQDRANMLRMEQKAGGISNAAQSAVERGMAQRGLAGSGLEFALKQQGAQSAANAANTAAIEGAAEASDRYQRALGQAGQMSGQMRGQEMDAMHAQDAINMFNARAQTEADRVNQQLPQQQFDNEMSVQAAEANARNGVAAGYERGAQQTRSTAAGVGNAAASMASYESEDELEGEPTRKYKKSSGAK
jgi:gas vesicle protein